MESIREWRKDLPADVLEEDGIFTRAFIQAVRKNGNSLVHFDRKECPLGIVKAEAVFEISNRCGLEERNIFKEHRQTIGFRDTSEVHLLLRYADGEARRCYPATVLKFGPVAAVSVRFPNGVERKKFITEPQLSTNRLRFTACANRAELRFITLTRDPPREMGEIMEQDVRFLEEFEKLLNCLVVDTDNTGTAKSVRLLVPKLGIIRASLSDLLLGCTISPRAVQLIAEEVAKTAKRNSEHLGDVDAKRTCYDDVTRGEISEYALQSGNDFVTDATAYHVFHIPELVNRIFFCMDMVQRNSLRSVCKLWYDEAASRSVSRLARYDIVAAETPAASSCFSLERLTMMMICFNRHLETFVFYFDMAKYTGSEKRREVCITAVLPLSFCTRSS